MARNFRMLAKDLGYLLENQYTKLTTEVTEIRRMRIAFNKKLRAT